METAGGLSSTEQAMRRSDQVSLDVKKLAESLRAELAVRPAFSKSCCIYKVPERLRELNEKVFTPRVVSIGPIHHSKEKLKAMEEHKRLYLQEFLQLSKEKGVSMEDFIKAIKDNETRLRNCYAESIKLVSEDFVKMILMDSAFVIMFLLKDKDPRMLSVNDRECYGPLKKYEVRYDMWLLENQLPFFILDKLLKLSNIVEISMVKLTHDFFKAWGWDWWVTGDTWDKINSSEINHFVDFLRIYQKPSEEHKRAKFRPSSTPSVKELHQAGVGFGLSSSTNVLDIKFNKKEGRLEFPRVFLCCSTEILFRNLQAFEQCHGCYNYLNDYICLMGLLVKSAQDAEILIQNGIIENWLLNDEAVPNLFHNLQRENFQDSDNYLFADLIEDLDAYCKRRRNRWRANLKQNYFNTPWAAISVCGAVILLILTVIQTVCSIIQVRPY